jgi:hypothetical protein
MSEPMRNIIDSSTSHMNDTSILSRRSNIPHRSKRGSLRRQNSKNFEGQVLFKEKSIPESPETKKGIRLPPLAERNTPTSAVGNGGMTNRSMVSVKPSNMIQTFMAENPDEKGSNPHSRNNSQSKMGMYVLSDSLQKMTEGKGWAANIRGKNYLKKSFNGKGGGEGDLDQSQLMLQS